MSGLGMRERALLAVVGVIVLYVIAAGVWFFNAEAAWKKSARVYAKAKSDYRAECALIEKKNTLKQDYEDAKALMPTFGEGKATDTTWQRKLGSIAAKNLIVISQQQAGKEEVAGDVTELTIDVKSWEGSLEALVKFMYELENTTEGMFDIRSINFKPSSKKGYLKGNLAVTCAYMRDKQ